MTRDHSWEARERHKIVAKDSCWLTSIELRKIHSWVFVLIFSLSFSIAVGHNGVLGQAGWPSGNLASVLQPLNMWHLVTEPMNIQTPDRLYPYLIHCLPYVSKYWQPEEVMWRANRRWGRGRLLRTNKWDGGQLFSSFFVRTKSSLLGTVPARFLPLST